MYECDNCGAVFLQPKEVCERHGLYEGRGEYLDVCPHCGIAGMFEKKEGEVA